ncbi:BofC C-terminal domain-containing protein [Marinicrinis lubricantis]|uniref:BofC C-terminal domain-containing protein n=1 Tax=Marinicrinis lubricantis TaxID=2086470 RepID=A0ABW1ITR2_9BACL
MLFSSWLKQVKKKLKWKRRRWIFSVWILVLCGIGYIWDQYGSTAPFVRQESIAVGGIPVQSEEQEVLLRKMYICGEEEQSLGMLNGEQIQKLQGDHPEWQLERDDQEMLVFTQYIDDLSPKCKEEAFFGMDSSGHLSLFLGPPSEDQVIRTFFQIDIDYLESSLPADTVEQLYDGIPVRDVDEYNSVLSTYSDYAIEATEKAMKATEP